MQTRSTRVSQGREILRTEGLSKRYGAIQAVVDMHLRVHDSELCGSNG
jgi:ABC-type branched-subunit amino acid transport system ATPase component